MVTYEAFDQNVEINGQTVVTIVEEGMGRFSETYRKQAIAAPIRSLGKIRQHSTVEKNLHNDLR